ncbi:MAG TPA: thio(seleno)oxazole modification radical SAM maturase SbtM [Kineosporiaceae bacterium]|nr:thio(seleno)oxazole modification radical SAM maturase SbtM [Kineosporiaceae bacterium]
MLRDRWLGGRCSRSFILQWHLTNACEARCRHCYDRSDRAGLRGPDAIAVLDHMVTFCRTRHVTGQVCLTGGNPFLHPEFWEIYAAATFRQLRLSILGNPVPGKVLDRLIAIQTPVYYQVSLEGLSHQDAAVRGTRHFERTFSFLEEARKRGVTTHVMLTLTSDNLDDVLPLAEQLRGLTHRLSFNRLARTGAGTELAHPAPAELHAFLDRYTAAARTDPLLGWKDNLLQPARRRAGLPPFGGCTGHGCGAAFNFVAVLPDGQVHACRKFPSPIGKLPEQSLDTVWRSNAARRYRAGSRGCQGCALRRRCGGCLAVTHGEGLDPITERDPHCPGPV